MIRRIDHLILGDVHTLRMAVHGEEYRFRRTDKQRDQLANILGSYADDRRLSFTWRDATDAMRFVESECGGGK